METIDSLINQSVQRLRMQGDSESMMSSLNGSQDRQTKKCVEYTVAVMPNMMEFKQTYSLANSINLFYAPNRKPIHRTKYEDAAAPTLISAIKHYGNLHINLWLADHVNAISELAGSKEKINDQQQMLIAETLKHTFAKCNVAEVVLFFHKVIKGDFGKFYGRPDIMTLGDMANRYLEWLRGERVRVEGEQDRIEREKRYKEREETYIPSPFNYSGKKNK